MTAKTMHGRGCHFCKAMPLAVWEGRGEAKGKKKFFTNRWFSLFNQTVLC